MQVIHLTIENQYTSPKQPGAFLMRLFLTHLELCVVFQYQDSRKFPLMPHDSLCQWQLRKFHHSLYNF